MKITILDGEQRPGKTAFGEYVGTVASHLRSSGHQVDRLVLRELEIKQCLGCWGCWVKTPGECILEDDGGRVCRSVIRSDVTLFAAPLVMGFPTALLKRTIDRLLPLIHPYNAVVAGEIHHRARYKRYPTFALLTERSNGDTDEDLRVVEAVFSRTALNFKSELAFLHETSAPAEKVAHAIAP
jgi:multimeric flavodoxin WrbA